MGCGGRSKRLELERTDVEALTDVSGTDASFAQACAAVWMYTRVSLRFCVLVVVSTVYLLVRGEIIVCVCVCSRVCRSAYVFDFWFLSYNKRQVDSRRSQYLMFPDYLFVIS